MSNLSFPSRAACYLLFAFLPLLAVGQTDTVPPTLLCKGQQTATVFCQSPTFFLPSELLESYTDNITPASDLEFGLRLSCTGSGFPENQPLLYLNADDAYTQPSIEVWGRDQAGNTAVCLTSLDLMEMFFCKLYKSAGARFAGTNLDISNVQFDLTATRCPNEYLHWEGVMTSTNPVLHFTGGIPTGFQGQATANKNTHPLNGITIHDLFLISQHIQGITPLTNPWQLIAADADQDGQITKNDLLTLRRLMSGLVSELPNGRSWRFVPANFGFDPLQPLVFPETVTALEGESHFYFSGVKIGDVDFSADPAL